MVAAQRKKKIAPLFHVFFHGKKNIAGKAKMIGGMRRSKAATGWAPA